MTDVLIRLPEVLAKTGLKRSLLYEFISKNEFPKQIKIGDRAVAWIESEIDEWIQNKITESRRTNERSN